MDDTDGVQVGIVLLPVGALPLEVLDGERNVQSLGVWW